jgi:hypothetical protein
MQDNNKSDKPEEFSKNEEHLPNEQEITTPSSTPEEFSKNEEHLLNEQEITIPENPDSYGSSFDDQEGEILPPDKKKNSSKGVVGLFFILILIGSSGYLYLNSLIPPEILNFFFSQPTSSMPSGLITQIPLSMEEKLAVNETPEPVEIVGNTHSEPAKFPTKPSKSLERHISGYESTPNISGSNFGQTTTEKKPPEVSRLEAADPVVEKELVEKQQLIETPTTDTISSLQSASQGPVIEKELDRKQQLIETPTTDTISSLQPASQGPVIEKELDRKQQLIETPTTDTISSLQPASQDPNNPLRGKAVQAYLDFIESSLQKLVELTKEGFDLSWDYLKEKLSVLSPFSNKL